MTLEEEAEEEEEEERRRRRRRLIQLYYARENLRFGSAISSSSTGKTNTFAAARCCASTMVRRACRRRFFERRRDVGTRYGIEALLRRHFRTRVCCNRTTSRRGSEARKMLKKLQELKMNENVSHVEEDGGRCDDVEIHHARTRRVRRDGKTFLG